MIRLMFWTFVAVLVLCYAPMIVVALGLAWIITHRKEVFR